ncbi:Nucleotidyltransferase domain-containing protein [Cnuella takakiae]|uniref:Nucleotidyltransferase domain-containing protein n=1 Tax=Cnuella takakiae TaxID=1302690 RepID=A0A1M4X3I7_9BACT|nr:nucleotidyltransferase domain-containing protein [Cnuella takakiae]OLY91547.1 hypothetical protein BUE76_06235 [Cnuella takakiae]SHE88015.1 Nucleotidyltransferase domain-containing protein [Cnuella takakiae]
MVTDKEIKELTRLVVDTVQPRSLYLFGSYATGAQGPDSDVDFLIVMPDRTKKVQEVIAGIRKEMGWNKYPFAIDFVVEYADKFDRFSDVPHSFIGNIVKTGKLLYAS